MTSERSRWFARSLGTLCVATSFMACATSPLGRKQLLLYPDDEVAELGSAAFSQIKKEVPRTRNAMAREIVNCVATRVLSVIPEDKNQQFAHWELEVFSDETPNAFALPGGKIGVNTGMLTVADNADQLAAVIAHEVSHVIARHTNERLSRISLVETGLGATSILLGGDGADRRALLAALGVGAQVGVLLPFSRTQETEADVLGLRLMAEAGFDPHEAVTLWRNMERVSGGGGPTFLSTHPSDEARRKELASRIPEVMPLYQEALATKGAPNCENEAAPLARTRSGSPATLDALHAASSADEPFQP